MFVRVKWRPGPGRTTAEPGSQEKSSMPRNSTAVRGSVAMYVQLLAANQCNIKFNKFNALSGVLAEGVGYQCMLEVPLLQ
jgi:hypothetical protein